MVPPGSPVPDPFGLAAAGLLILALLAAGLRWWAQEPLCPPDLARWVRDRSRSLVRLAGHLPGLGRPTPRKEPDVPRRPRDLVRAAAEPLGRVAFLPADDFDPRPEEVDQLASMLVDYGELPHAPAASALLTIELRSDDEARLVYFWHAPVSVLGYPGQVWPDLIGVDQAVFAAGEDQTGPQLGQSTARGELVLVGHPSDPVAADPDGQAPVAEIAEVYQRLRRDLGEYAVVAVGLRPLPADEVAIVRARAAKVGRRAPAPERAKAAMVLDGQALWNVQMLLRAWSDSPRRADAILDALTEVVQRINGANQWSRVPDQDRVGRVVAGPNARAEHAAFDARLFTGAWAPAKVMLLTTEELEPWLTPPTRRCAAGNVLRAGDQPGLLAGGAGPLADEQAGDGEDPEALPVDLPVYTGHGPIGPLGVLGDDDGGLIAGVDLDEFLFGVTSGRTGCGKSTSAAARWLHWTTRHEWRDGWRGGLFLDPAVDTVRALKGVLAADASAAARVWELNLTSDRMPGWNPFAVAGRPRRELPDRAGAIINALAAVTGWSDTHAGSAYSICTQAIHTLLELATVLPEELAPTLFSVPTLLLDDDWRAAALPHLSARAQRYWLKQFPAGRPERINPVANVITRLGMRPEIAALLGQPDNSYDLRRAMDEGLIVLACPYVTGSDDLQAIVANLIVADVLRAALSREDIPRKDDRRPFLATFDEASTYAGSRALRRIPAETRKFGLKAEILTQHPSQLPGRLWDALVTNSSQLITGTLHPDDAKRIAQGWDDLALTATISRLPRHQYVAAVDHRGVRTDPFGLRGVPLERLFPTADDDAVAELDALIDERMGRRLVDDVVAELNGEDGLPAHDDRILAWLVDHAPRERIDLPGPGPGSDHDADSPARRRGRERGYRLIDGGGEL